MSGKVQNAIPGSVVSSRYETRDPEKYVEIKSKRACIKVFKEIMSNYNFDKDQLELKNGIKFNIFENNNKSKLPGLILIEDWKGRTDVMVKDLIVGIDSKNGKKDDISIQLPEHSRVFVKKDANDIVGSGDHNNYVDVE